MSKSLGILFIASEAFPLVKVGGLADVVGALPKALAKLGHQVSIAIPFYACIRCEEFALTPLGEPFNVEVAGEGHHVRVFTTTLGNSRNPVYLFSNERYFGRDGVYGFEDDPQRFLFFSRAVLQFLRISGLRPDILHTNDWQTALVPTWLARKGHLDPFYERMATIYTIHNLGYQGLASDSMLPFAGLDGAVEHLEVEPPSQVNWMAQGIAHADMVSTVSERYGQEILTPELGAGLDPLLRQRQGRLRGILNGLDYEPWNPATDEDIAFRFDMDSLERRTSNKRALQEEAGLEVGEDIPLVGMVSRLVDQKGFDIMEPIVHRLASDQAHFVLLGTGDARYHHMVSALKAHYPTNVSVFLKFDDPLAHRIYAGADIFLMPSRYEPCGLGQMIAMRYGCVPVVRATGGLADTVSGYDGVSGTGFTFQEYSADALWCALSQALELYRRDQDAWRGLQLRGMALDLSWDAAARKYELLYREAIELHASDTR